MSPVRRAWPALLLLASVLALVCRVADWPEDDISAAQHADAIEHAQRDAEERDVRAAYAQRRNQ